MSILLSITLGLGAGASPSATTGEEALSVQPPAPSPYTEYLSLAPRSDNTIVWSWKDGIRFQTEDGSVKGKFGGRMHLDASAIDADDTLPSGTDGMEVRRARMFVQLDWDNWGLKAQYDWVGGGTSLKDLYIKRKDALGSADLRVGHFKEPFSISQLTSSKYYTFLEFSLPASFTVGRNLGVGLSDTWGSDSGTWGVGIFRQDTNDGGVAAGAGNLAVTARGTWTPVYRNEGENLVHVGAGFSLRNNDMVRLRSRPELHLSDRYIDTGTLMSEDVTLANLELATVQGPFHGNFEYFMADVGGRDGMEDVTFGGYHFAFGYFLTGESRPYKRSSGVWDRVRPDSRFTKGGKGEGKKGGGLGAMETAIRYSVLDLDDEGITGGEQSNITLGFNWYLTPNLRWGVNYIMGDVEYQGSPDGDFSAIGTRLMVDW